MEPTGSLLWSQGLTLVHILSYTNPVNCLTLYHTFTSIYNFVFKMASWLQIFQQRLPMNFSSVLCMLCTPHIQSYLIWPPLKYLLKTHFEAPNHAKFPSPQSLPTALGPCIFLSNLEFVINNFTITHTACIFTHKACTFTHSTHIHTQSTHIHTYSTHTKHAHSHTQNTHIHTHSMHIHTQSTYVG